MGILARMLEVRVWDRYGPVASDKTAVSMPLFCCAHLRYRYCSVER